MKKGYIEQNKRKKILLITDDIASPTGIGHIARELVTHTSHAYNWACIGGSINHPQKGMRVDFSEDTNKKCDITDSYVISYPTDGYGNPELLRQLMEIEKPDALMLITDPRSFEWVFQMENEIRKQIPIVYLNIWDDGPAPYYNGPAYASCDLLMSISKQTKLFNRLVLENEGVNYIDLDGGESSGIAIKGKKYPNKKPSLISYVPHGLDHNVFYPIQETDSKWEEYSTYKKNIFGGVEKDFVLFFNSRNIRRKQIPDTLFAFKIFLDSLPKEKADKCAFILHTELMSEHGTDLIAVQDMLFGDYENVVFFSGNKISENELNYLYNLSDAQILLSNNEGWGLSLTEALLTGTPIIANVTGGMQDQMRFLDEENNWYTNSPDIPSNHTGAFKKCGKWAFPVFPTNRSIQGSITTPYIWDDRCNAEDAAIQIGNTYELKRKGELKDRGLRGREWAIGDEANFTSEKMSNKFQENMDYLFNNWEPREKFSIIDTNISSKPKLNHKLVY
jgi:glycosyltransferase involved in cell wall biosynthesis